MVQGCIKPVKKTRFGSCSPEIFHYVGDWLAGLIFVRQQNIVSSRVKINFQFCLAIVLFIAGACRAIAYHHREEAVHLVYSALLLLGTAAVRYRQFYQIVCP